MCSQTLDVPEFLLTLHLTNPLYPFRTLPQNGMRCDLRASKYQKFPGRACPQTPLLLLAYTRTRVFHALKKKTFCENPGYGPAVGIHCVDSKQSQA